MALAKASISISNTISAHMGKVFFKILNFSGANMNDAVNYVADLGKIYYSFSKQTNLWFCTWQTIKQTKKS